MHRRRLIELNLIDDFLFHAMVSHPQVGEEFGRILLKIIFNRKFGNLKVVPQKVYYGKDTDKHGGRLDVYLEEAVETEKLLLDVTVFDLEMEQKSTRKEELPRRVRFYHSLLDAEILKSGAGYDSLKRAIVLVITTFDPFGFDHMIYTIRNICEEVPEMNYDDGARTLFLYTKGRKGKITKDHRELMCYLEDTREENAANEDLKRIHEMVKVVKRDSEVSKEYMKIFERERMIREEGIEKGLEKGREEERANTERERQRAEAEARRANEQALRANEQARRANEAEQQVEYLKKIMQEYGIVV